MSSFFRLFEDSRSAGKDFWYPADDVEGGQELIKRGLEIRTDRKDGKTFWDDFLAVFGQNLDEAERLLGVPRDKIAQWGGRVRKVLNTVRAETDEESRNDKKKKVMMPTGHEL